MKGHHKKGREGGFINEKLRGGGMTQGVLKVSAMSNALGFVERLEALRGWYSVPIRAMRRALRHRSMKWMMVLSVALAFTSMAVAGQEGGRSEFSFQKHAMSAECARTYACKVTYAGLDHADQEADQLAPPLRRDILTRSRGAQLGIENFPKPAVVSWISEDGTYHREEVDMGAIFKTQVLLYKGSSDDIYRIAPEPEILLVVEDRTIRVYMKSVIFLKRPVDPTNRFSNSREDTVLAFEEVY